MGTHDETLSFNSDGDFRTDIRSAMRRDVFDATPAYQDLSPKATSMLLQDDSSLQGSWRQGTMPLLTAVLEKAFGDEAPIKGEQLMNKIGALCGSNPSTHWIDIVGVQDRLLSHSWHQDTGLPGTSTVLWGFPPTDDYTGCGIFSHIIPLSKPASAPPNHARMEPVLYRGTLGDETCIVRPAYAPGRELLVYSDVHVLHSSPDVAYRKSVMRFM